MMRRNEWAFFPTLILIVLAAGVSVAGTVDLPRTGQVKCYDESGEEIDCQGTGQDGEYRAGVLWKEGPRFQTIMPIADCNWDSLTGLWWPKDANAGGEKMTWDEAMEFVADFEACGFALQSWRLPNVTELESLIHAGVPLTSTWLLEQDFINTLGDSYTNTYWTSTSCDAYPEDWAFGVDMDRGNINPLRKSSRHFVWLVHGGTSGPGKLWETGQKTSYVPGDDGDLEAGVEWPDPRFTDHGNGTVTDELTGLMWTKDADAPGPTSCWPAAIKSWQRALEHLECINNRNLYGYSDWRLPNRKELFSLLDWGQHDPPLPIGHPFSQVQLEQYWTSTTVTLNPDDYAFYLEMENGTLGEGWKGHGRRVWPVRGGLLDNPTFALSLTKNGTGEGTVISEPPGIDCGVDCPDQSNTFDEGTNVTLTATPDTGSLFTFWTGACRGIPTTCEVTMNADTAVVATFVPHDTRRFKLSVKRAKSQKGDGAVVSEDGLIACDAGHNVCKTLHYEGLTAVLSASVSYPNTFLGWQPSSLCTGTGPCSFVMQRPTTITARFDGPRKLTVSLSPQRGGQGTVETPHLTCASKKCTDNFQKGERVEFAAIPASGSTFKNWVGGPCPEATNPVCTLTMDKSRSVKAVFVGGGGP